MALSIEKVCFKSHCAEYRYAPRLYAECRYAQCLYTECRDLYMIF
jgi:hypothetical protein